MKTKWHIVPINDGYTLMYRDSTGKLYLNRKENLDDNELAFETEEIAKQYIIDQLNPNSYKAEIFWTTK